MGAGIITAGIMGEKGTMGGGAPRTTVGRTWTREETGNGLMLQSIETDMAWT